MEVLKRIGICLLALCLVVVLTACGGGKDVDIDALAADLAASGAFTGDISQYQVASGAAAGTIGFAAEDVDSCIMYYNGSAGEEVLLAKAADGGADTIKGLCQTHVENQKASLANYVPEAIPKLDSAILETSGDYVIFVVAADAAAARTVVDGYLK